MEIERKFLVENVPDNLDNFDYTDIEQGYICTKPVVRVRKDGDRYYLTCKGDGMMSRAEYEIPLTEEAYRHMLAKADGCIIKKRRYRIPEKNNLTIELDYFSSPNEGLYLAEVEFETIAQAESYEPPEWFGKEVTFDKKYQNSNMAVSCR